MPIYLKSAAFERHRPPPGLIFVKASRKQSYSCNNMQFLWHPGQAGLGPVYNKVRSYFTDRRFNKRAPC